VINTHEDDDASIVIPSAIVLLRNEEVEDTLVSFLAFRERGFVDARHLAPTNFVPVRDGGRSFGRNGAGYVGCFFFFLHVFCSLFCLSCSNFLFVTMILDNDSGQSRCGIVASHLELYHWKEGERQRQR